MSSLHLLDPCGSEIYQCAQAGCPMCLNRLLKHHEGLIQVVLREQYLGGHSAYADLVQEGRIALWHAILRYDPARGTRFSSFAGVAIRRQIWRAVVLAERGWVGERPATGLDPAEQVEAAWFWQQLRVEVAQAVRNCRSGCARSSTSIMAWLVMSPGASRPWADCTASAGSGPGICAMMLCSCYGWRHFPPSCANFANVLTGQPISALKP